MTAPTARLLVSRRLRPGTMRAAVTPTRRAMEWLPVGVTSAVAAALVVHGLVTQPDLAAVGHVVRLRMAMALLAAACAFAFEDPAGPTVASSPVPLSRRRLLRFGLVTVAWLAGWAVVLGLAGTAGGTLPVAQLTLEATGWLGLALAAAATAGAAAVAPVLLAAFVVMTRLPDRWALLGPLGGDWTAVHARWAALAAAGLAVVAWTSRDPAR